MSLPRYWLWHFGMALLVVAILLGAAVFLLIRFEDSVARGLCGVNIRRVVASPTGTSALVAFEVDCGATTPFSSQVSLIPYGASFSRETYPPFFSVKGQHDLALQWVNSKLVELRVPPNAQVYRKLSRVGDIAVAYR